MRQRISLRYILDEAIRLLATYGLNETSILPRTMSVGSGFLQSTQLIVIDKPKGYGLNTSLVIDSPDPKYLGVILYEKSPIRIFYGGAKYEDHLPVGIDGPNEYAEIMDMLKQLNLPYPNQPGLLIPLLESLLTIVGAPYSDQLSTNITRSSALYESKFSKTTSGTWPLANRENLG